MKKKKKQSSISPKPQPPKKQFNCIRCGHCCIFSTPTFTKEEYKKVRDLKITKDRNILFQKVNFGIININGRDVQEYAYFTTNGYTTFKMGAKAAKIQDPPPCEYLDKDKEGHYSCAIYPFRPSVCRDFGVKEWDCPNNPDYLKKGNN